MRPSASAIRSRIAGAALLGTVALLAACGTATTGGGSAATSTPAAPPTSASPSPSPTTASPTPAASTGANVAGCATSALKAAVDVTRGSAAAGSIYYPLDLTNISGSTCTVFGYPGVSFVTGPSGTILGRAAHRNPVAAATTVTLAPGQAAHATLQVAEAGNYDPSQCQPVTAHWLRIYPPNQTVPLYAQFTTQACSARLPQGIGSQLSITVFQPGAS
ncbi:MAG TPA: DUF4232 domain-containing protein [Streptosporangiaceae bacterium]|nr:DUF4232 domain-containing protein [Streptosporangiaceae bacterium]